MTRMIPLNNVDHAAMRVSVRHGAAFGDSVNQMLILPAEYEEAQREFPILFRRDGNGDYQSVVLLGLDLDENLFLRDGRWDSRFLPAIQKRGPFVIGAANPADPEASPVIHVDLDDARVGDPDGHPLFLPQGGSTPYLKQVSRALQTLATGRDTGRQMFAALAAYGLIEPIALELSLDDGRKYVLPDFHGIGAERLAELDGAALEQLNRDGSLRLAVLVMASLANMNRLIERKLRKLAEAA